MGFIIYKIELIKFWFIQLMLGINHKSKIVLTAKYSSFIFVKFCNDVSLATILQTSDTFFGPDPDQCPMKPRFMTK